MTVCVLAATTVLALLLSVALAREVRLRRALQGLLARILTTWRSQHANERLSEDPDPVAGSRDHDRM